jgi:hypothetical protein
MFIIATDKWLGLQSDTILLFVIIIYLTAIRF